MAVTPRKWHLFRLMGLRMPATKARLSTSLLGDASLISRDDAKILLNRLAKFRASDATAWQIIRQYLDLFFGPDQRFFDTALLICADGSIPHKAGHTPLARARELTGMLNLAVLVDSNFRKAVAFVDRCAFANSQSISFTATASPEFQFTYNREAIEPVVLNSGHQIDRRRLGRLLKTGELAALAAIVRLRASTGRSELQAEVCRVATLLSESTSSDDAEPRILGCVMAIEIIVCEGRVSYSRIEKRVRALVGGPLWLSLRGKATFDRRHGYVHRGRTASEIQVKLAIALATAVICKVANLAQTLASKKQLANYLDVVAASDSALDGCPAEHAASLKGVRHHRRSGDAP